MDQGLRTRLRSVVTQCRRLLEESIAQQLQGRFDIYATGKKDEVKAEDDVPLGHLSDEERQARQDILAHFKHIDSLVHKPKDSLDQLIREIAFTHLNRLCAYKMMEVRDVYVGGQRFREAVSKGLKSQGFLFYLADHPEDEKRHNAGDQETAYRHFLNWLGGTLSKEIGVLFSPTDPANRVYPPQRVLDEVLDLLNSDELRGIWSEDETIGWVYQYFTPKELRDQARKESAAPRNSYELAFRNQFFTPRYVVEFLTDNTLGRIWYEMRKGSTRLKDECRYMVRRSGEVFFSEYEEEPGSPVRVMRELLLGGTVERFREFTVGDIQPLIKLALTVDGYERHSIENAGDPNWWPWSTSRGIERSEDLSGFSTLDLLDVLFIHARGHHITGDYGDLEPVCYRIGNEIRRRCMEGRKEDATQEQLLRAMTVIPHRPKKDPREIKILDPACGSGHFLLYCFDLLLVIYEEAYDDPDLGEALHTEYPTKDDLRRALPGLILRHNLHGIDIDLRAVQIAGLALWLRCQRAYQEMGLKKDRPPITKANVVCAEPMPGEKDLLNEFLKTLRDDRLEALIRQATQVPEGTRLRATKAMAESLSDLVRTVWEKMRLAGEAGSLLKIEEELRDAIRKGQDEWEERLPLFRLTEYGLSEAPQERLVRFVPGDVEGQPTTFWDKAEGLVRLALDESVEYASNERRFQRRLFVEDARQGLGFVDVCRQRYDVVLMNPPFGDSSTPAKATIDKQYPRTKNDLYAAFVERGLDRLDPSGMLGAITSRTGFFLSSFTKWREELLLKEVTPTVFADLGYGVLDTAMVETAAYCVQNSTGHGTAAFFRLLHADDKDADLLQELQSPGEKTFHVAAASFAQVPGSPFAYWVSERVRNLFVTLPPVESDGRSVKVGVQTFDDFRFVRARWETSSEARNRMWIPFVKGGAHSRFYTDIHLVVNFANGGLEMSEFKYKHRPREGLQHRAAEYYGRPGLTWPRRSQRGLALRVLPRGCIFSDKGPTLFVEGDSEIKLLALLGLLNSTAFRGLVALQMAFGSFEVGVIQRTAIFRWNEGETLRIAKVVREAWEAICASDTVHCTSNAFVVPALIAAPGNTLADRATAWVARVRTREEAVDAIQAEIDNFAFRFYGLEATDRTAFTATFATEAANHAASEAGEDEDVVTSFADSPTLVAELLDYALGAAFGHWNVRFATSDKPALPEPAPFDPLPVCPPGMLQNEQYLPLTEEDAQRLKAAHKWDYPLHINWDGIIPDDPDNTNDIIRRMRDILELIWKDRADAIEKEACEILGVADLRDYFRKPGAGGFWDDHIKRYSKSRRKAPIYWLLQSSKKNYALWIYYHRLDKDILFKALLNYVEPKIRLVLGQLSSVRGQIQNARDLGQRTKDFRKLEKEAERLESFLSELRDFEEKLRRAANLHLDPDLNDGVVLNIAPLRELVPWKEAKAYWDDLMDGKYEWSSIGKQLREKGLVR